MELESDLAKELFNKVIVPLQTKNKQKEITVQNEYERNQEQLQKERIAQQQLAESKRIAAKVIADEKAQRMAAEKEQLRLERIETERIAQAAEEARIAQVAEEARIAQAAKETRIAQAEEEARIASEKAESERMLQQSIPVTNLESVNIPPPVPPVLSNKNIVSDSQGQLPPKPPKTCKANERDVIPSIDCKPHKQGPNRQASVRFHPDKNPDCKDIADEKFKQLTNICEKYTPPASTSEPSSTEPSSSDMLTLPSSEPPSSEMLTLPSTEPISTELGESILESPIQNKFNVNPLIETLRTTLNKDMSPKTVSSQEPSATVHETIVPEIVSSQEPVPKFNVNQLINILNKPLATSVPSVEKTLNIDSTPSIVEKKPIYEQNNETEEMYISNLDKALEEAKKNQYVDAALSATVPVQSATVPVQPAIMPVQSTETVDWTEKLDWLKQSVGLLVSSLSNMFTFMPAVDNDPYKLSPDKESEGYIYIGKMYMKEEDETSLSSKPVKYVNYHPDKKDFYIDERPEVKK